MIFEYLLIPIPAILGYLFGSICNVGKDSGEVVSFRPPPIVFGVVWIILYLFIGVSWFLAVKDTESKLLTYTFYILLNIALCSWIYLYSCKNDKKNAIYVLLISFVFSLLCYTIGNRNSKMLIVPLIGWILFAMLLNIFEVEKLTNKSL
jgi:tryptophan-rich sensory protein